MAVMQKLDVQIRWSIRRDMPEILAIESECFGYDMWTEDDFIQCLKQRNCIGMVAEHNERIVGYMVYELLKGSLHILNFAVHPNYRRRGIGSQLVEKLVAKLSQQRRTSLFLEVRETNLDAQLFFSRCGFWATDVLPGFYEDSNDDAYRFVYELGAVR